MRRVGVSFASAADDAEFQAPYLQTPGPLNWTIGRNNGLDARRATAMPPRSAGPPPNWQRTPPEVILAHGRRHRRGEPLQPAAITS
jgi:hypothetical protein